MSTNGFLLTIGGLRRRYTNLGKNLIKLSNNISGEEEKILSDTFKLETKSQTLIKK